MNYLKYKKEEPIVNGTTTIVKQKAYIKAGTDLAVQALKADKAINNFIKYDNDPYFEDYQTKGIAKVDPKDTFDAKKGETIARIKAELLAQRNFNTEVYNAIKEAEKLQKALEKALKDSAVIIEGLEERLEDM